MKVPENVPACPMVDPWSGWTCREYSLQVVTPILGGGAKAGEPEQGFAVRPSAIRGHLRFWWRTLFADGRSGKELKKAEAEIWGGRSWDDAGKEVMLTSNVIMSVVGSSKKADLDRNNKTHIRQDGKVAIDQSFGFVMGREPAPQHYALFPAQESKNNIQLVSPGLKFQLEIRTKLDDELSTQVISSVAAWIHFGGVGARTRRGMGSLKCDTNLEVPTIPNGCILGMSSNDPMAAWSLSLKEYKSFRQKRRAGTDKLYGRSYWPEPDSYRSITNCWNIHKPLNTQSGGIGDLEDTPAFPRAAFGLPIGTKFQSYGQYGYKQDEVPKQELLPACHKDSDRMASPVITKPMFVNGQWYATAIFLSTKTNPTLTVKLKSALNRSYDNNRICVSNGVPKELGTTNRTDPIVAFQEYLSNNSFTIIRGQL